MVKVYVTYGYGTNLRNCYSVVEAPTVADAHAIIGDVTEGKYAFSYTDSADFQRQITQYGLVEVSLQPQKKLED